MSNYPKFYSDVCKSKSNDYVDCENYDIHYGDSHNYQIKRKISRGNYSDVYEGIDLKSNQKVIVKVLKPINVSKIRREIKILKLLNGKRNTIKLLDVVLYPNSKVPSLVFEYIKNSCEQDFRAFFASLGEKDIKFYMLEILKALDYINSMGIMHRDIKPHNFVIDHEKRILKLIDFGLAEFYVPDQIYNTRVASRYFKAPELLLNNPFYHYSIDIWALGCFFAGILFLKEPFFAGQDTREQLIKIAKVVGVGEVTAYGEKYNLKVDESIYEVKNSSKPLKLFINDSNRNRISDDALGLLEKMLEVDHSKRITARDSMNHNYFKMRNSSAQRSKDRKQKQTKPVLPSKGLRASELKQQFNYRRPSPNQFKDNRSSVIVANNKENSHSKTTASKQMYKSELQNKSLKSSVMHDITNFTLTSNEIPDSNINVVVRIRPILQKESQSKDFCIVRTNEKNEIFIIDPKDLEIRQNRESVSTQSETHMFGIPRKSIKSSSKNQSPTKNQYERCYSFDKVFDNDSTNMQIYLKATKQLTRVVLNGYNATIFAYGVTGAGKTHTMIGYENEPGLMYYTINEIFDGIRALNQQKTDSEDTFHVDVSFLEIYNEQIRDLIVPAQSGLELREDPKHGIQIQGLSVFEVRDQNQIFQLLAKGNSNRTQESTMTNQTSSRSHAVLMITYHNNNDSSCYSEVKSGKLSLIDLAGSERASRTGNTGLRMKEGANINKSLLALGNCINVLYENSKTGQQKHVPFRDSKLTRILKESLTGNSKTLMIANISPSGHNYEDTLNTLKYANRTKNLKTNMKKNVTVPPANDAALIEKQNQHINMLQGEIESLRAELAQSKEQLKLKSVNTQPLSGTLKKQDDDDLFLEIKQQIHDQFHEESYKHTQLKNLYIEYENLLFFQKRLKIDIFIQGNKQLNNNDQNIQKIQFLQDQLIGISAQEPNLLQRIDAIRNELKKLLRQRAKLRDYMYQQFKLIPRRGQKSFKANDQEGQDNLFSQTLSNTQAEILETLFHSQEQVMRNNTMKMKEQRLNIKMAKREYMINCMAEQVGLREFTNFVSTPQRRNLMSKQQIDEILQDSDAGSEKRLAQQLNYGSNFLAEFSGDNYYNSSTKKQKQKSRYLFHNSSSHKDQLGRFICTTQTNSPLKQKSFRSKINRNPRVRTAGSFDLQNDPAFKLKSKLNTTRNQPRIKFSKTMFSNEKNYPLKEDLNQNETSMDENKTGIQLYQPSAKKRPKQIQINEFFDLSNGKHARSNSVRTSTLEEMAKQQDYIDKVQQYKLSITLQLQNGSFPQNTLGKDSKKELTELESQQNEPFQKLNSNQQIDLGSQYQANSDLVDKKTNSSYVQFMRNQAFQKRTISSKNKIVSRQKYSSPCSSLGYDSRPSNLRGNQGKTYTFGGDTNQKSKSRQRENSQVADQQTGPNLHYYKTQANLNSRKHSIESHQSNQSEKSPYTPNPQKTASCISDSISPSNRRNLYKALRDSQKKQKNQQQQSSNKTSSINELRSVVDDANQIEDYEDCKGSIVVSKPVDKAGHQHTQSYQQSSTGITVPNTVFNTGVKEKEGALSSSEVEREKSQVSKSRTNSSGQRSNSKIQGYHKRVNTDFSTNHSQGNSQILLQKNVIPNYTLGKASKGQSNQQPNIYFKKGIEQKNSTKLSSDLKVRKIRTNK